MHKFTACRCRPPIRMKEEKQLPMAKYQKCLWWTNNSFCSGLRAKDSHFAWIAYLDCTIDIISKCDIPCFLILCCCLNYCPSLNATDFLERLRGQRLVFVGDSLNRNMWESLVCILRHSVSDKKSVHEISGKTEFKKKGFYAFRFEVSFLTYQWLKKDFFSLCIWVLVPSLFSRIIIAQWILSVLLFLLENQHSMVKMVPLRHWDWIWWTNQLQCIMMLMFWFLTRLTGGLMRRPLKG